MANEEKLMELLRRAHTVIGEGLIENALDESAAELHNEIGQLFGLAPMKRDSVRCATTWFVAGGRDERRCSEDAEVVCSRCERGFCEEHAQNIAIYKIDCKPVCEDCLEPSENTGTLEDYEWRGARRTPTRRVRAQGLAADDCFHIDHGETTKP